MEKQKALLVLNELLVENPNPESELHFTNPYETLVAVILSAQCLDKRVNMVTPKLFDRYKDVYAMANADIKEVEEYIKSINFYHNKAKFIVNSAKKIVEDFGGVVPSNMDDLLKLDGVSRKTAQVVLMEAFNINAIPVDTHIFRVVNKVFNKNFKTPLETEKFLREVYPEDVFAKLHRILVLHGRYVCKAKKPECANCRIKMLCENYEK